MSGEKKPGLYEQLRAYARTDFYPMHMPGHKRNEAVFERGNGSASGEMPENMGGLDPAVRIPYGIDITEIDGFDNLHLAEGIIKEAMDRAADLYGADRTFFLVNGSTCGLLAAISACTEPGNRILLARNCHKAVYNAAYLRQLKPVYLYPRREENFGICGGISPEDLEEALNIYPDIRAAVITSPTFEGMLSDVKALAETAHAHGIPLIVDEAHGAHLGFGHGFPDHAVHAGADLVIHSVHKTLPAPTQTALLHCCNRDLLDRTARFLGIYQSSSPSYILMAGIERCIGLMEERRDELFSGWQKRLEEFYRDTEMLTGLRLLTGDRLSGREKAGIAAADPGKLLISVKGTGKSGEWLYRTLIERYRIQPEMASGDYVVCMTGLGDTQEGMDRLKEACREISRELKREGDSVNAAEYGSGIWNRKITVPERYSYEVMDSDVENILLCDSAGRISAEYIYLYPPGIPLIVPGERIDKDICDDFRSYRQSGLALKGMKDGSGERLLVCNV